MHDQGETMQRKVQAWELPGEEQRVQLNLISDLTATLADTTITYIGLFKLVRMRHYLIRYGWIFLAVGCLCLATILTLART